MVEDVALVGPPEKIREELARWRGHVHHDVPRQRPAKALAGYAELLAAETLPYLSYSRSKSSAYVA
jgi:hypothetical protein